MKRANPLRPWAFAYLYDKLVATAQDNGYALALHGSMNRDLDLVAIPWTENASTKEVLLAELDEAMSRYQLEPFRKKKTNIKSGTKKPHGRVAYSLHLGGEPYVDISILPRRIARKKKTIRKGRGNGN